MNEASAKRTKPDPDRDVVAMLCVRLYRQTSVASERADGRCVNEKEKKDVDERINE